METRSPVVVPTGFPQVPPSPEGDLVTEYWFGSFGAVYDTMHARFGPRVFAYWQRQYSPDVWEWAERLGASAIQRSIPGVWLVHNGSYGTIAVSVGNVRNTTQLGSVPGVTMLQLSGDGKKYFARDTTGWKQHNQGNTWTAVGFQDHLLDMSVSFDGSSYVQSKPFSPTFYYKSGSDGTLKTATLPNNDPNRVYTALIGSTIFAAQGKNVYTVGSKSSLVKLAVAKGLDSDATGIWADQTTVWVATGTATFMSNDLGWTWIEQPGSVAVGPGIYITGPSDPLVVSSTDSFVDSVGFPLKLNNSGALSSDTTNFRSGFELSGVLAGSTPITEQTKLAMSPDGRFVLTQYADGVFTEHQRFRRMVQTQRPGMQNRLR